MQMNDQRYSARQGSDRISEHCAGKQRHSNGRQRGCSRRQQMGR